MEISRKIESFSEKSRVPNVVAAIDRSHIPIKARKENHEDYFNRKHCYSYLMQGIVVSSGLFLAELHARKAHAWAEPHC